MMHSRDRVRKTIAHEKPDRPPADGFFRAEVWTSLRAHFGTTDDDRILDALGFDFRRAVLEPSDAFAATAAPAPVSVGVGAGTRNLVRILPNGVFEDDRGLRRVIDSEKKYFHYVSPPLEHAETPDVYQFPDPGLPERYAHLRHQVQRYKDRFMIQIETGNIFRDAWELRGYEQFLIDLHDNPEFVTRLLERVTEHKIAEVKRMVGEGADIIQMAGDIATEKQMMISPRWWRAEIKPRLAQVIAATRRPGVYYYFHSDGAMQLVIPDLIEIGFDIVDPMQPECMDLLALKRAYGARITFHSTLSSQQTLPFGSVADVRAEVAARKRDLAQDGGLILAPSNVVQHDVPLPNLLALYDEVGRQNSDGKD
jgi:uroporphyrinogen decarboxylase